METNSQQLIRVFGQLYEQYSWMNEEIDLMMRTILSKEKRFDKMQLLPLLTACSLQMLVLFPHALSEYWKHGNSKLNPSCDNLIYCESELMHDVQISYAFNDSKDFVDMKLKYPGPEIMSNYSALKDLNGGQVPSREDLIKFVNEHLEMGNDLENWTMPDFVKIPSIVNNISDTMYKEWAIKLNNLWILLAKKVKDDVKINPDRYSVIWVPNGFVVPGGRFRELYYWDTYWIVNGLMLCDMKNTARGIIDNMVSMVDQFGYVPNGGRVYYLNRSQPPMLILMVLSYFESTGNFEYVQQVLPSLERELLFWLDNRLVTFEKEGQSYSMARYYAPSRGPRPESYREDYNIAKQFKTQEERDDFYINVKSGAETGWDFSGRWYINSNGSNTGQLSDIQTSNIVPVDLNSIIQINAKIMCSWFDRIGNQIKADKYCTIAQQFLNSIREVMWRPDKGAWFDWDLKNHKHREYFYVSNILPLWTESYDTPKNEVADMVLKYLMDQHIIESDYKIIFNGIPTSMENTTQQWDYPNAWPSLQAFIIQGLEKTQQPLAHQMAVKLTDVWLRSNYIQFESKLHMYEKYPVSNAIDTATGGEYSTQIGFGWTNGVVFELLSQYGDQVSFKETKK